MSNKRKLRLQPHRETRLTTIGGARAHAWERCQFHDDCCDPEDMTCSRACGAPAEVVLIHRFDDGREARSPFCERHIAAMGIIAEHMLRTQTAESN
jgi:hypothetical protein